MKFFDIYSLPIELYYVIFEYLSIEELINISLVCKKFHILIKKDEMWYKLILRDYPVYKDYKIKDYRYTYLKFYNRTGYIYNHEGGLIYDKRCFNMIVNHPQYFNSACFFISIEGHLIKYSYSVDPRISLPRGPPFCSEYRIDPLINIEYVNNQIIVTTIFNKCYKIEFNFQIVEFVVREIPNISIFSSSGEELILESFDKDIKGEEHDISFLASHKKIFKNEVYI